MAKASAKDPRADYALPEKKAYPLNTPGRRKIAVYDAVKSERMGNATPAEVAKVKRAVASRSKASAKSVGENSRVDMRQDKAQAKRTGQTMKQVEASAQDKKRDAVRMKAAKKK